MTKHTSDSRGFTLPELLVAMFIFTIIVGAIYNVFDLHNRMAARQEETTSMQQELLAAMSQMTYDLRMCGFSNNLNASRTAFTHANDTEIHCWIGDREIAYQINNNTLRYHNDMTKNGTYQPAAENIGALQFSYFAENGIQLADPQDNLNAIRAVEITAIAIPSPRRTGLQISNRTMSTRVQARNSRNTRYNIP